MARYKRLEMSAAEIDALPGKIGDLSALQTTAKGSLVAAVNEVNSRYIGTESVTVKFKEASGTMSLEGLVVTIRFAAGAEHATLTKTLDENGECTFTANYGEFYRIEPAEVSGYMCLKSRYYGALTASRRIVMWYVKNETGFYILDSDMGITKASEWNTADNDKAMFIICSNSQQQIVIPKAINVSSHIFQPEYVDCPLVTNRNSATDANADFAGKSQCDAWVLWATTPDETTGETPIQAYNRTSGKSYTLDQYLGAIRAAYNKTITIDVDKVLHGYLPAMGQLRYMCDNHYDIKAVHTMVGGVGFPDLRSGYWWSCSEGNYNFCWNLYGGATNGNFKPSSYQVFALYDLSEINL